MRRSLIEAQADPPCVTHHDRGDRQHPRPQRLRFPYPPPRPPLLCRGTAGSGDQPRPGDEAHCQDRHMTPRLIHPETLVREFPQPAVFQVPDPLLGCCCKLLAESRDGSVFHPLRLAACRRSQAASKTRLTITASGFGCP